MQSFAKQVGDTGAMMAAISAVVFFVILLIVGNTMAQSVRERTAELGVLKTIGFTDLAVTGMVLGESLLLATLAGVIGLGLATVAAKVFAKAVQAFLPIFYVPPRSVVTGVVLAVMLGLASGGLPAFMARRLTIVEALRRR
jgi:putative ABC transport system permease protein